MRLCQWMAPVPLLVTALLPSQSLAASCDASIIGSDVIGREFVAIAGPNADGEYYYTTIDLQCDDGNLTWYTFPYTYDLGWHHPNFFYQTLPPPGFRTNHRVFVNACGTRLVGVNRNYTGEISGIDMSLADYPLQEGNYQDEFEQPLYIEYGQEIGHCIAPPPPADENLGAQRDCHDPVVDDNVNALSGNNYYHEEDFLDGDLGFEHAYNSQAEYQGAMGPNWQHPFEQSLSVESDSITAIRPDGGVELFTNSGNGWTSEQNSTATIQPSSSATPGYQYTDRNGSVDRYDASGVWQSTTRADGTTLTGSYDGPNLTSVQDRHGNSMDLTYDGQQLSSVTAPGQRTFRVHYNASGMLSTVTRPDDSTIDYHYEDSAFSKGLTGVSDSAGKRRLTWRYDDRRRVIEMFRGPDSGLLNRNARNFSLRYEDTSTTVTNPLGRSTLYHLTGDEHSRRVARVEGVASASCLGADQHLTYNAKGQLGSKIDRNGNETRYAYNDRGLRSQRIEALGSTEERITTTLWHPTLNKPQRIDEGSRQAQFDYDSTGRLLGRTLLDTSGHGSAARSWSYIYGENGRLQSIDGPRNDVDDRWHFEYDAAGDLSSAINPHGHSFTVQEVNAAGQPTRATDANGVDSLISYDNLGRPTSITTAALTTTLAYHDDGQIAELTLPSAGAIAYDYDDAGHLVAITNNRGESIRYQLDAAGNRTAQEIRDSSGTVVFRSEHRYDELDRLREQFDASDQTTQAYAYDAEGNRIEDLEPLGARLSRLYDALNRISRIVQRDQGVISFSYDPLDRIDTITDPRGLVTDYDYDGLGNLLRLDSPDTGVTHFSYDAAGNLLQRTDARGVETHYRYDALNRLAGISHPSDPWLDVHYHYDDASNGNHGIGRLTRIDDASGSTALVYDAQGQALRKTVMLGSQSYTWRYSYLPSGEATGIQSPSGFQVAYQYHETGLLAGVTTRQSPSAEEEPLLTDIAWHPFGPVKQWRYANGITTHYALDENYRLSELGATGDALVLLRSYSYNPLQDITRIDDGLHSAASQSLLYDPEHRLQQATGPFGTIDYSYDEVGNRLDLRIAHENHLETNAYRYATDSNRLEWVESTVNDQESSNAYTYDANGNLTATQSHIFSYNEANRMSYTSGENQSQMMAYNALGQRVIIARGSDLLHFHYDQAGRLVGESNGSSGAFTREYIYAADQLVAVIDYSLIDRDADGLDDDWELQHFGSLNHDGRGDADGDFLNDRLEYLYGFDPTSTDGGSSGNNGILDIWEQHYFGQTDIAPDADADADGSSNRDEYRQGTDPTDPEDKLDFALWLIPVLF